MEKKQQVRTVFKIGGFLAFILLGYLGIRSYKLSVEKLKINACTDELFELVSNIKDMFRNQSDYGKLDYKEVEKLRLIPKSMKREGYREATNAYLGGVDIFYSSTSPSYKNSAFEISFQGLSSFGCKELIKLDWNAQGGTSLIAVGGYGVATPSGVLDEIYLDTDAKNIKSQHIFKGADAPYVSQERLDRACSCNDNVCSVVWKFN